MANLRFTSNLPFSLEDWQQRDIVRLFAGTDCLMALTADGQVLQKIRNPNLGARTVFWRRIRDIGLGHCFPGLAIARVEDGTCMIAKRPLRVLCQEFLEQPEAFDRIHGELKTWSNLTQVAVNDAYWGLEGSGRVNCVPLLRRSDPRDYREVARWENVTRLIPHVQNGMLAITGQGRVLTAGANFRNRFSGLGELGEVVEAAVCGTDWPRIRFLCGDGTLRDEENRVLARGLAPEGVRLWSHIWGVLLRNPDGTLNYDHWQGERPDLGPVRDLAIGDHQGIPFVVALEQ